MKKGLVLTLATLSVLSMASCGDNSLSPAVKVGIISVGDKTETYSKAHLDGIEEAAKKLGVSVIEKTGIPESDAVTDAATQIYNQGAKLIFTNSYGHQDYAFQFARTHTDATVVADTGDYAAISGLSNYKNAFTDIYQARYVSGYVGGMKLKELVNGKKLADSNKDANGNWKIGYVGAYKYAEVISGMTAFYLGVKAGFGGENVAMSVQYTSSWYDHDGEKTAAQTLINAGCVLIGQHADSTGAPEACEEALSAGKQVFSVGYNIDMTTAAPNAALTSATNNWEKYYEEAIGAYLKNESIPVDWAKGYNDDAVAITALGKNAPAGAKDKVAELEKAIKDGTLHVFDTSKFTVSKEQTGVTVDGDKHVTSAKVDFSHYNFGSDGKATLVFQGETKETVKKEGSASFIEESVQRSAPYFAIRIDGITDLN